MGVIIAICSLFHTSPSANEYQHPIACISLFVKPHRVTTVKTRTARLQVIKTVKWLCLNASFADLRESGHLLETFPGN
jgi:hypothetical protein